MFLNRTLNLHGARIRLGVLAAGPEHVPLSRRRRRGHLAVAAVTDGTMVSTPTPFGVLELPFDRSVTDFDPSRWGDKDYEQREQQIRYVAAAFLSMPRELSQWPQNEYTEAVLWAARDTLHPLTGRNVLGFDVLGFDADGVNRRGFRHDGIHVLTGTGFDPAGWDAENRSVTGISRPQAWYDVMLDQSLRLGTYLSVARRGAPAAAGSQWELAQRLIDTARHHVDPAVPLHALCVIADDLIDTVIPSMQHGHAASLPQHASSIRDWDSALQTAQRMEHSMDPDDLAFDVNLTSLLLQRRFAGRFALTDAIPPPPHELDDLASSLVTQLRAHLVLHP